MRTSCPRSGQGAHGRLSIDRFWWATNRNSFWQEENASAVRWRPARCWNVGSPHQLPSRAMWKNKFREGWETWCAYLDDRLTIVGDLGVRDDFKLHASVVHNFLESWSPILGLYRTPKDINSEKHLWGWSIGYLCWKSWIFELGNKASIGYVIITIRNYGRLPDKNSSECSDETWAISRSRMVPS